MTAPVNALTQQAFIAALRESDLDLRVCTETVHTWIRKGMPTVPGKKKPRFHFPSCRAWLLANKVEAPKPVRNVNDWASRQQERFFLVYGGKCALCGEADKIVLTLDHVRGDGAHERRQLGKGPARHWKKAADHYDPEKYRILCHNCQFKEKLRLGLNAQSRVIPVPADGPEHHGPLFAESA